MKTILIIILAIPSFCCYAQEDIQMKKTFFGTKFYSNGRVLKPKEVLVLMQLDEEAHAVFKKAKSNYDAASVLGFIGGFMVGWPIGTALGGGEPQWGLAAGGAAFILLSIPLNDTFKRHAKKAVNLYNGTPMAYKPTFYISPYGMGAKLTLKL